MTISSTDNLLNPAIDPKQNIISRPTNTTHDQENPKPTPDQTDTQDLSLVTNEDFLSGIFPTVEDDTFIAVCSKTGDPTEGGWIAKRADSASLPSSNNNYFTCSTFKSREDGTYKVRKVQSVSCYGIMLDDVGTKVLRVSLGGIIPTWEIETSPGNYQIGFAFKEPISDIEVVDQLSTAIIAKGLSDPGAGGPATRWARLPNGSNGKEKYKDENGDQFPCQLVGWRPEHRYTPHELHEALGLKLPEEKRIVENSVLHKTPPQSVIKASTSNGETGKNSLQSEAVLNLIDPDSGYRIWSTCGMIIHHETGGSDEGMALFDAWSSKGTKYKGIKDIEIKWRSFKRDVPNPVTIATLIKFAKDGGADVSAIMGDSFDVCEYEVIYPATNVDTGSEQGDLQLNPADAIAQGKAKRTPLDKYSLLGMSDEIEKRALDEVPVLGEIALLGQCTLLYAPPNVGKTLITIKLLMESIEQGRIDPNNVYYINVDDTYNGLLDKLRIAEEYGFNMLTEGYRDFKPSGFLQNIESMIDSDNTRGVILILDTLKKFANLMDKGNSAFFANTIRRFVMHGGTVVGLAHTNKHRDNEGKLVPAGTSDFPDDFDSSYILDTVSQDANQKVVQFTRKKNRGGNSPSSVSYSYSIERGIQYNELLLSVQWVDETQLEIMKQTVAELPDAELISIIESCINDGVNTKMKMAEAAAERVNFSKRKVLKVIEKYTGKDPAIHKWSFSRKERGAMVYALLECLSSNPTDEPITSL